MVSYRNQLFFEVSPCTLLLPNPSSEKRPPSPFSLTKKRIHMDSHLKEELTVLFWKLLGIPYPHRQSANHYITTLCQWLILTSCVRDSLYDKYTLFTHFHLMQWKNRGLVCISSKQRISWRWTHNSSVDQSTKKLSIVQMNYWTCFFTGAAVSVNWFTTPVSLC